MDVYQFVKKLAQMPIDKEALKKQGVSDIFIQHLEDQYHLKLKIKKHQKDIEIDPILTLIDLYDAHKLEIGMVSFLEHAQERDTDYLFGYFETEPLVLKKGTGSIVCLDSYTDEQVYLVAKTSNTFFEALIIAGYFLEKSSTDDFLYENSKVSSSTAHECANASGGELLFYQVLIGCD